MTTMAVALEFAGLGWGVIPLKSKSKQPLIAWRALQHRKLNEREIVEIFEQNPDANLGVITGRVSNLLVLDADAPDVVKKWGVPITPISETARGRHYYFHLPDGKIRSATGLADGLDLRAEGGYVVAPPSVHPSGKSYEWVIPPTEAEPSPPPAWILELLRKHRARHKAASLAEIAHGVPEGQRNISSAKLIGYLLAHLPPDLWESIAWPLVRGWNQLNRPPLSERDLRYTFDSIARRELQKQTKHEDKETQIVRALQVAFKYSNLSQRQLAQLSNVPQSKLSRLLNPNNLVMNHFEKKSGFKSALFSESDSRPIHERG
jgi:predicted XRE-type DNA-binding protein